MYIFNFPRSEKSEGNGKGSSALNESGELIPSSLLLTFQDLSFVLIVSDAFEFVVFL